MPSPAETHRIATFVNANVSPTIAVNQDLNDSVLMRFGTGQDITMGWDGTDFDILQATADSSFKWGVDGAGIDQVWYGDTATVNMTWDQTADALEFTDNAKIVLGTGNDVTIKWDGTRLVGSAAANPMWDDCPSPLDPNYRSQCFEYFDDFTGQFDTTATVGNWTAYTVGTGTTAPLDDVAGGILRFSCQATTDDACEQVNATNASFLPAAGKTIWYETRIKITGDVQSEHSFGLVAVGEDLSAVADVLPQDGISFSTQDATLAAALTASKNGTNTGAVAGVHTLVTATWVTLGFKVDGVTSVTPYVNGVAGTAATATIPDDEALTPYFLVRNGDGTTTQILDVDYVRVVQLR